MRKPPTPAQLAWSASPRFREIARQQCWKTNAERWAGPRCGAKKRSDGEPCRNLPMANGRCRLHGGRTPKGSQWHVRQKPATSAPEAVEQKIRRQAKKQKRRAALVAQATPEQQEAHEAWQKSHQPGDPKKRAAERVRRKQNREAAAILRQERPASPRSAERAALVAALDALEAPQRHLAEAKAAETYDGVFS